VSHSDGHASTTMASCVDVVQCHCILAADKLVYFCEEANLVDDQPVCTFAELDD